MTHRLTAAIIACTLFVTLSAQSTPRSAADDLLAADRAFAAAAAKTDIITGLSAMFSADVVLTHAGGIAVGVAPAIEALTASPINRDGRLEWTPARVGLSGDRRHGFTAGFMTLHRADGSTTPMKYLAYWEKQPQGWRVRAYKRGVAKTAAPAMPVTYILPLRIVAPVADAAALERHRESLAEAERSFSREAQTIGIGAAFTRYGHPDAINLGGPDVPTFLIGNQQIGNGVAVGAPTDSSPVSWGPRPDHHRRQRRLRRHHRLHRPQCAGPGRQDSARPAVLHDLETRLAEGPLALHRGVTRCPNAGAARPH
jgi:hypothetical protein